MAYRYSNETEVTVLGGLRVTIGFDMEAADPSVGMGASIDWAITEIAGRPLRAKESAQWIMKKLSKRDMAEIEEKCEQSVQDAYDDARIDAYQNSREYY